MALTSMETTNRTQVIKSSQSCLGAGKLRLAYSMRATTKTRSMKVMLEPPLSCPCIEERLYKIGVATLGCAHRAYRAFLDRHVYSQRSSSEGLNTMPRRSTDADSPKLVQEIESQAVSAQRDISTAKAAASSKKRDIRMLELTSSEVKELSRDTKVYEGVGKM